MFRVTLALWGALVALLLIFSLMGDNATRVRNSLIAHIGFEKDFSWHPELPPNTYHSEKHTTPDQVVKIVEDIISPENLTKGKDFFNQGLIISKHLSNNKHYGYAIRKNILKTYDEIIKGGGYCADYERVFTALLHAGHIPVRRWGFGNHGYGAGHAFNEVYDDKLKKWVMIDTYNSFYFVDKEANHPLSVRELQNHFSTNQFDYQLKVVKISPEHFGLRSEVAAINYYRKSYDQFYMFWGDNVFTYEDNIFVYFFSKTSRVLEIFVAILIGVYPDIKLALVESSEQHLHKLWLTGIIFKILLLSVFIFSCLILFFMIARVVLNNETNKISLSNMFIRFREIFIRKAIV